jgi:hypothetical protein
MQACLARLYVDEPFRKLFRVDSQAALEGYELAPEEVGALRALDSARLDQFASSLVSKRRKPVERAYPLLFALNAAVMRRYYRRFFHLYPARARQGHHQDAVDFGEFIEESLVGTEQVPAYARDLARYERLYYLAQVGVAATGQDPAGAPAESAGATVALDAQPSRGPDVRVAEFAHDVAAIEEGLQKEQPPAAASVAGRCTIAFAPRTGSSDVRMLKINEPTQLVVDLCDGRRTVARIVTETEAALGATDLRASVVATVTRLVEAGVLVLDPVAAAPQASRLPSCGGPVQTESLAREE